MDFFSWVALPLFIFFARIADVSMGTLRVIFIAKGFKYYAPIVAFFESVIWLLAVSQILLNITNPWLIIVYGLGFAVGTFSGIWLEEKISLGKSRIRFVIRTNYKEILGALENKNYLLTVVNAGYKKNTAKVVTLVTDRRKIKKVIQIVNDINPKVFYSVEDVRKVSEEDDNYNEKSIIQYIKEFDPFKKAK
ncbi:MAG: DUF5698 domain-containing protein [archaeon]|nr:DUF5698 domain-containing protein [archaeon]